MKLHLLAWLECPPSSIETFSWPHREPLEQHWDVGLNSPPTSWLLTLVWGGTTFYSHLPLELAAPYLQRTARPVIHLEEKENSISAELFLPETNL